MRILLISSAFSGMTQRFYTELEDAGYPVSVELHTGDVEQLLSGVNLFKPDLILCPFLTRKIPGKIYNNYRTLIVHPGIKGDRGPSSLDWAIQTGEPEWGVTLLEASEQMDSGDIWSTKVFPLRAATKSSVFNREVIDSAIDCLWEVLTYFESPDFKPEPLNYRNPDVKGELQPMMRQQDRKINWRKDTTEEVLRKIHAADGSPGVLDEINGKAYYLYNAHKAENLSGKPGRIIAKSHNAICRATTDGAIWIGHLKAKTTNGKNEIKLPATFLFNEYFPSPEQSSNRLSGFFKKTITHIDIDYMEEGKQLPCQEIWYVVENRVAYVNFAFHNGGMSTEQCQLLLSVYRHVTTLDINVIVLMGGEESWSNGIHLNHIEYAANPADESWRNINAIDDLILQIMNTTDKVTLSAVAGNAGAGGAILAIATDKVFVREGVVINPHYKNMGKLFGSEYWTYLLPKRIGEKMAAELTEEKRLPVSAKNAWRIGLIDNMLDKNHKIFYAQVKHLANAYVADKRMLQEALKEKSETRCFDEANKPLASYRRFELTQMYANFYGNQDYHEARRNFVYKISDNKTPENIAPHRRKEELGNQPALGSMSHFIWQQRYETGDDAMDGQHKDLFSIAEKMLVSGAQVEQMETMRSLYRHVEEHFAAEELEMEKARYQRFDAHKKEHRAMLDILARMEREIQDGQMKPSIMHTFVRRWGQHIAHSDISFNDYVKQRVA